MINRVVLVGRLVRDVEIKRTTSNQAVCNFSIAVDNLYQKDANGERTTSFINCVVWNKGAEIMEKYCKKGSQIGIDGRLQSRTYDRKDGSKASVVEVICDSITLLGGKTSGGSNDFKPEEPREVVNNTTSNDSFPDFDLADDDLPF